MQHKVRYFEYISKINLVKRCTAPGLEGDAHRLNAGMETEILIPNNLRNGHVMFFSQKKERRQRGKSAVEEVVCC